MSMRVYEYWRSESAPSHGIDTTILRQIRLALHDIARGSADWRVWTFMAQHEIRQRYRRSTLGPLWLTLGLAVNVTAISTIWSHLFSLEPRDFVPYLTLGMMVWNLIVGMVVEGCHTFNTASGYITQTNRPLSTYAFQTVWRNLLIASHSLVVYIGVATVFALVPNRNTLWVLASLPLLLVTISWPPLLLGVLSARFRDIPQIIQNVLTVAFFVTPVLWHAEQLGDRAFFATLNPMAHIIELVRRPLLGQPLAVESWIWALGTAAIGWSVTIVVFARNRARVPYWL
jgi:ABC-2 type transport system permease protein